MSSTEKIDGLKEEFDMFADHTVDTLRKMSATSVADPLASETDADEFTPKTDRRLSSSMVSALKDDLPPAMVKSASGDAENSRIRDEMSPVKRWDKTSVL